MNQYPRHLTLTEIQEQFPSLIQLQQALIGQGFYAEVNVQKLGENYFKANVAVEGPEEEVRAAIAALQQSPQGGFTVTRSSIE